MGGKPLGAGDPDSAKSDQNDDGTSSYGRSGAVSSRINRWIGDVARALNFAQPEELGELYSALRLALTYNHTEQILDVGVGPMGTVWISFVSEGDTHLNHTC